MHMYEAGWYAAAVFFADLAIRIGLSLRVIMRRRPVGVSLAWLTLVLMVPFLGAFVYLMVGELRLGIRRARRSAMLRPVYRDWRRSLGTAGMLIGRSCATGASRWRGCRTRRSEFPPHPEMSCNCSPMP